MSEIIYKILDRGALDDARAQGLFRGSAADCADGYIHFSTESQVRETAAKHFGGRADLALVAVAADRLPEGLLKWEPSRNGALFPHLYAPLDMAAVVAVYPLPLEADGLHSFPALTFGEETRCP